MPPSPRMELPVPEPKFLTPILITCSGIVQSRPRVVRRRAHQTPRQVCEFVFKFSTTYAPGEPIPNIDDEHVIRQYEEKVVSLLSVEGIYTDKEGVIQQFNKPDRDPWWVELKSIGSKTLKTIPIPADSFIYNDDPIIIDSTLVKE